MICSSFFSFLFRSNFLPLCCNYWCENNLVVDSLEAKVGICWLQIVPTSLLLKRWRPLYNPVFPSQMKRSRPVGYLHYRDNPLVEAILRQQPFCLKVEITEISKPFISNDWAGSLKPHRGKVSIARPQVAAATTKMKEILILWREFSNTCSDSKGIKPWDVPRRELCLSYNMSWS